MKYLSSLFTLVIMVAVLCARPAQASQKQPIDTQNHSRTTTIAVQVVDLDAKPVANARITVAPLGVTGTTDQKGGWSAGIARAVADTELEVTVEASGYRTWIIHNPVLRMNDTLILDAVLSPLGDSKNEPEHIQVQSHRQASDEAQKPESAASGATPNVAGTNTSLPTSIRVYRVQLNRIDEVEFRDYVKHVLPNEWISSWQTESLRSGAMASKTYSWYRTMSPKYPGLGYDTKDTTADQVYNPSVSYASTNQAVDDTWNYKITRNNAIFQTQYCAGSSNASRTTGQCGENHGYNNFPLGNYMSQWGSQYLASQGQTWQTILGFYYDSIAITPISGDPPAGNGSISAFVLGVNNVLWQRVYSNGAWANWQEVGSPANGATSEPGAVSSASGQVDVFIRGGDNALWQRTAINGAWGAWQSRGGGLSAAPDATSPGTGQLDVIIKGNDNHLYRRAFRSGAWGAWEFLSSPNSLGATSDPAIASENGRLVVFVRGSDNALWRRELSGSAWGAWTTMGGSMTSAPDAASYGPGHLDVVVRGSDNMLYHRVFLNGAWSDWSGLAAPPSVATTNPSIVAAGGRVDVFVRGSNNALWQRSNINGTWGVWEDRGGNLSSGPDAAAFGTTVITPPPTNTPLAVPYIAQYQGLGSSNCDCGPASVAMIVRYLGRSSLGDSNLVAEVRQLTGSSTATCTYTSFSQLQSALTQYNLTSSQIPNTLSPAPSAQIQAMKNATASGKPVIAFVHGPSLGRSANYGDHWIVVKGFSSDGQTVYVNDPDNQPARWTGWIQGGSITLPIATFTQALVDAASAPYGIIVN